MKDIRKITKKWAQKVGYREAVNRLIQQTVSPRAAELLCKGEYPYEPKALRRTLLEELAKDGFSLASDKAS